MVEIKGRLGKSGPELNRWQMLAVMTLFSLIPALYCVGLGWLGLTAYNKLARWTQRREANRR